MTLLVCINLLGQPNSNKIQNIKVDFTSRQNEYWQEFKVNQINTINDKLYVLGKFDTVNSTPCKNAIVFDGLKWRPVPLGNDFVEGHAIIQFRGNTYISGAWGNGETAGLKMLNQNGTWNYVGTGNSPRYYNNPILIGNQNEQLIITAMTVFKDELICAGSVGPIGSISENIIKWNGTSWSVLTPKENPFRFKEITDVIVFREQLYFGGTYGFTGDLFSPLIKLEGDSLIKVVFDKKIGDVTQMVVFDNNLIIATDKGLYKWDGNYCTTIISDTHINDLFRQNDELYFTRGYEDRVGVLNQSLQITYINLPYESNQKGLGFYRGAIVTPFCSGCRTDFIGNFFKN